MGVSKLQVELFRVIKTGIPDNLSFTQEIAKVLNVSIDSAYRRIRGEKMLSLEELYNLCSHYKISIDSVFNVQTGSISFQSNSFNPNEVHYKRYIDEAAKFLTSLNGFKEKKFYFIPRDLPFFYHYQFREFAAFKYYFWMRNLYHHPDFISRKFRFEDYPDEVFAAGQKLLALYNQLSIFEFWGFDVITGTLRQIDYFKEIGMFHSNEEVFKIYVAFEKLIEHIKSQAGLGYKYDYGDLEKKPMGEYSLFYRDLLSGDNNMLFILDGMKLSVVPHSGNNYMNTRDLYFNENMYRYIMGVMKTSTRISSVGEWERSKFFHTLQERIAKRKNAL